MEMTYDEVVDNLIKTRWACEHKAVDIYSECKHSVDECEYKRWLALEIEINARSGGKACLNK